MRRNHEGEVNELIKQAEKALKHEDYEEAVGLLKQALQQAPFSSRARYLLASALQGKAPAEELSPPKQEFAMSKEEAKRQFRLPAVFWLGAAALTLILFVGIFATSHGVFTRLVSQVLSADVLQSKTKRIEEFQRRLDAELANGEYEKARQVIAEYRVKYPEMEELCTRRLGEVYYQEAMLKLGRREERAGEQLLMQAVASSEHVEALYELGRINYDRGKEAGRQREVARRYFGAAAEYLERLLKQESGHLKGCELLANTYVKLNRPGQAVKLYEEIIERFPNTPAAKQAEFNLKNLRGG